MTFLQQMLNFFSQGGGGCIINVSSLGAFVPGKGLAVYGATKAFLNYFSQALQEELELVEIVFGLGIDSQDII